MIPALGHFLAYSGSILLLTIIGNYACRTCLKWSGLLSPPPADGRANRSEEDGARVAPVSTSHAGRWIGSLERLLIMIGLAANSWEVMVAVVALKTVARYQELDRRHEAEYFLVGSLVSIFWAVAVTLVLLWYDRAFGLNLSGLLLLQR